MDVIVARAARLGRFVEALSIMLGAYVARHLRTLMYGYVIMTAGVVTAVVLRSQPKVGDLPTLGVLTVGVVATSALDRNIKRQRLHGGELAYTNFFPMWVIAAFVAMPAPYATIVAMITYIPFCGGRCPLPWLRWSFGAASLFLGATLGQGLVAKLSLAGSSGALPPVHNAFGVAYVALGATLCMIVNRGSIAAFNFITARALSWRQACGAPGELAIEITVAACGVLAGVAILHNPLVLLSFVPLLFLLERSLLHSQLLNATRVDAKTAVATSSYWREIAERDISRAMRDSTYLSVLMIDLDKFKAINDAHGHLAGDYVLREVARALSTCVRKYDLIGRFGGEEFVALMSGAGSSDAAIVAERIRASVESLTLSYEQQVIPVTVSAGVATLSLHTESLESLLSEADRAMYDAKRGGRNRVSIAGVAVG